MIERIIDWCAGNRFMVFTATLLLMFGGLYAMRGVPLDAVPDISDVQVIVYTTWEGRSPNLIEDQVTYPIVTSLISAPGVKTVRGFSDFGYSYVYVIFEEGTDIYWARSRVLEYMQQIAGKLPPGVTPGLGPDASGVGWVFEYALVSESGEHDLATLRTLQDWFLRFELKTVPDVAEVATDKASPSTTDSANSGASPGAKGMAAQARAVRAAPQSIWPMRPWRSEKRPKKGLVRATVTTWDENSAPVSQAGCPRSCETMGKKASKLP